MNKRLILVMMVGVVAAALGVAQSHSDDPAMQRARVETQVITDLGRALGFVHRIDKEMPNLALNRTQAIAVRAMIEEIRSISRMTPRVAEGMLSRLEERILSAAQLAQFDRMWLEAEQSRTNVPGSGTGQGAGTRSGEQGTSAAGSIASYVAGGPFNPLIDTARPQGQDIAALYERLAARAR